MCVWRESKTERENERERERDQALQRVLNEQHTILRRVRCVQASCVARRGCSQCCEVKVRRKELAAISLDELACNHRAHSGKTGIKLTSLLILRSDRLGVLYATARSSYCVQYATARGLRPANLIIASIDFSEWGVTTRLLLCLTRVQMDTAMVRVNVIVETFLRFSFPLFLKVLSRRSAAAYVYD